LYERSRVLRAQASALSTHSQLGRKRAEALIDVAVQKLVQTPAPLGGRGSTFSLRVARTKPSVRLVRHHLRRWLESAWIEPGEVVDITLACSEACANAVEHPLRARRQAFQVEASHGPDGVRLSVRDFGAWDPTASRPTRGRGLSLIRNLMDSAEIVSGPLGAEVVMHRARRSPPLADSTCSCQHEPDDDRRPRK
jgi:anti-sigma regulatory factor (Ser/Thr protein kinase)